MTEEPHRSRRMAIMKAHPEVCLRHPPEKQPAHNLGHQTNGPRTDNKICRAVRRSPAVDMRHPSSPHLTILACVYIHSLHRRRDGQPQLVSCHPRNNPQPRILQHSAKQVARHLCQFTHRYPLFCCVQGIPHTLEYWVILTMSVGLPYRTPQISRPRRH